MHLKHLALADDLSPVALGAAVRVRDALTGALALAASALHLLDHARANLAHCYLNSLALAVGASDRHPALGTRARALSTDLIAAKGHLLGDSVVKVLKGEFEGMGDIFSLTGAAGPSSATTSEEGLENVEGVVAATAARALLQPLLSIFVIYLALLGIAKDVVGVADLLEDLHVAALVGVVLDSRLLVCLLQLVGRGALRHAQQLVELLVVHRAGGTTAAHSAGETPGKTTREPHDVGRLCISGDGTPAGRHRNPRIEIL
mmetsp:Transcript_5763/g.16185  ORF Transcript_5763/g.16185 Transcript_5763/m.16185 type:complete len:260 (+) Transcript_5763:1151-1930(+)